MRLSDLKKKTRTLAIAHQGDELNVEYRLNVATPIFLAELETIENTDENITRQLQELIAKWDLLDDAGQEIAVSLELVQSIPRPFWQKIIDAILEDMRVAAEIKKD